MSLEVAAAVGGAYLLLVIAKRLLLVIAKRIRDRSWRTGSSHRTPFDYAVGALLAFLCALLWALSYVSLKFVSGRVLAVVVGLR